MSERCNVCHKTAEEHRAGLFCCAHCGASAVLHTNIRDRYRPQCHSCGLTFEGTEPAWSNAREVWNRRASPWRKLSDYPPPHDLPIYMRSYQDGRWERPTLTRGFNATEDTFQWRVKHNADLWEWMAIPE